jgi:hypothetical protein
MAVSSLSMTASVPSSTAFATSVASARVGSRLSTIERSIWVAVMTGFASRLASAIRRFCVSGTRSIGISTPRSPRATSTPSAARTISSMRSTAPARSIFAMIGRPLALRLAQVVGPLDERQCYHVDAVRHAEGEIAADPCR